MICLRHYGSSPPILTLPEPSSRQRCHPRYPTRMLHLALDLSFSMDFHDAIDAIITSMASCTISNTSIKSTNCRLLEKPPPSIRLGTRVGFSRSTSPTFIQTCYYEILARLESDSQHGVTYEF